MKQFIDLTNSSFYSLMTVTMNKNVPAANSTVTICAVCSHFIPQVTQTDQKRPYNTFTYLFVMTIMINVMDPTAATYVVCTVLPYNKKLLGSCMYIILTLYIICMTIWN